ncbi:MAG TPA: DUF1097 domain-containing protein [Candidatus Parcubacteria bacterium]|jgi:hypothetical protein|nr:DUF1097 domain-containing protein [Candidatus Parcubacteria bacterium]
MRKVPVSKWIPIALMVGIIAAIYVIIAREFNLILWAAFVSWPLYFLAGTTIKKMDEAVIGLTGGLIAGWGLVKLIPLFSGTFGAFWTLPVLVTIAAFIIVFLEIVPEFDMAPAYFLSFASFFAAMGILNSATGEVLGPGFDTVIKLWIPFMVGLGFAYLTGKLVKQFLST